LRRHVVRVLVPIAVASVGVGLWSSLAPLAGAVVAPAQVKVELNRKTVQHQEGGIVREILARDGQKVRAGDPLVILGDVRGDAALSLLEDQLRAERIRGARAAAEAMLQARFHVPADLAGNGEHVAREQALFAARRRTLDDQLAALEIQLGEARQQAGAFESRMAAAETSARLAAEEVGDNDGLVQQGFMHRNRLLPMRRAEADYRSKVGEFRGEFAATRQRIGEIESRAAQTRNQYLQQAADESKEASARVRDLEDRVRPSRDQVERQIVRAPVDGEVMALRISAVGEVVGPREPILELVPVHEKLVIEAHIRPEDVDYVRKGAAAEVRLTTPDARNARMLRGKVVFVSPDRVSRPDRGDSWFIATAEVDATSLAGQPDTRMQAGMAAERYVTTSERSLLEYLAKPLGGFAHRAMRER